MAIEIERKFLVRDDSWRQGATGVDIVQGYLCTHPERVVRVRLAGARGTLTVKGSASGIARTELEYEIPGEDARTLLAMCERPLLEKTRYAVDVDARRWEVDVFGGENAELVVAEIELEHESQAFTRPAWVGEEVTGDPRYANARLVAEPFHRWRSR